MGQAKLRGSKEDRVREAQARAAEVEAVRLAAEKKLREEREAYAQAEYDFEINFVGPQMPKNRQWRSRRQMNRMALAYMMGILASIGLMR